MAINFVKLNAMFMGELNISYYTNHAKTQDESNSNLAGIRNCRVVNTSEVEGAKFISDKFKRLTGSDEINAREKYGKVNYRFKAGKILIQTNSMPEFTGNIDTAKLTVTVVPEICPDESRTANTAGALFCTVVGVPDT